MKSIKIVSTAFIYLVLAACVTINIYFPAAAADKAAEKIVDDILGLQQQEGGEDGAALLDHLYDSISLNPLDWLIPVAHAATPDFTVDTVQIRQLQAAMKQRHVQLQEHYASGAVGYTVDGLVALRDEGSVALKLRMQLKKLVAGENQDRNALYQAIAAANGHPEWESQVRSVFAGKWIEKAAAGWWYQAADGGWREK